MNYQLTQDSIIIEGREPIDKKEFEKWLLSNTSIERDEFATFWKGVCDCYQPQEVLQDFMDQQTAFTEFDGIKKGIDRICR